LSKLKQLLSRFLPPSARGFHEKAHELLAITTKLTQMNASLQDELLKQNEQMAFLQSGVLQEIQNMQAQNTEIHDKILECFSKMDGQLVAINHTDKSIGDLSSALLREITSAKKEIKDTRVMLRDFIKHSAETILKDKPVNKSRYLFVNDTFDTFHHGCTGTSFVIRKMLGDSVASVRFELLLSYMAPKKIEDFFSEEFKIKWERENDWLINKAELCDEIVINGEGSMAMYRPFTLNYFYLAYYCMKHLGKKVHVINHSIGLTQYHVEMSETDAENFSSIIKLVYSDVSSCYVRETESMSCMESILPGKAKLSFDCLPIYITKYYKQTDNIVRNKIVISGGNFLPDWFPRFIDEVLKSLPEDFSDMPVKFLLSEMPCKEYTGDVNLYKAITKSVGKQVDLVAVSSTDEWLDELAFASIFISGRFHHSIACFMLDTPFLAFKTNNKKMEGMLDIIKKKDCLLDGDFEEVVERSATILRNRDFYNPNSEAIKNMIVDLAYANFEFI